MQIHCSCHHGIIATASLAQAGNLGRPFTNVSPRQMADDRGLQTKVEALGYTVCNAKLNNACGEFYVTDKRGSYQPLPT